MVFWLRIHVHICLGLLWLVSPATTSAQHVVIFDDDDSKGANYRDASFGFSEGDDHLSLLGPSANKLPVETDHSYSGRDAGLLEYRHGNGSWEMFVAAPGWRGRDLSQMDSLLLFLNGPEEIPHEELPRIGLEDTDNEKTGLISLNTYLAKLDGDTTTWQRLSIPIEDFEPVGSFTASSTKTVRFADSATNDTTRTLWFDLIVAIASSTPPPDIPPAEVSTRDGDRSVIIRWTPSEGAVGHHVYRTDGAQEKLTRVTESLAGSSFTDFSVENGVEYHYSVEAIGPAGRSSGLSSEITARPSDLSDEEFLDLVARTAFDYFWYEANPANGLIKDRSTETSNSSIAAVGFGLTAIPIGIDNDWIDHDAGLDRVLTTLEFFWSSPHGPEPDVTGYRGFYYHFLNMETGRRAGTTELSTIDTSLLLAGVLFAKEYFDGSDAREERIRALADSIYGRIDWGWASPRPPRVGHGWRPESGFIPYDWGGYNEAMILYILALGSPTFPVPASAWAAWTSGYRWERHYGLSFVRFPPLFGHQYSQVWVDFRGIQDSYMRGRGIDYFENSRRATLANRAYCIDNPLGWEGYGPNIWGLTASDGPDGYRARGAPPAQNDDGTITPTAAGGSVAFTPEQSTAALRAMYDTYRTSLWGQYGLRDAFNPRRDWFGSDYLGIDQGPILLMIENLKNDAVWSRFMNNSDIQRGLERAGFQSVGTKSEPASELPEDSFSVAAAPNPFGRRTTLTFELSDREAIDLTVYDAIGRRVATLISERRAPGRHHVVVDASSWSPGVYHCVLTAGNQRWIGNLIHLK